MGLSKTQGRCHIRVIELKSIALVSILSKWRSRDDLAHMHAFRHARTQTLMHACTFFLSLKELDKVAVSQLPCKVEKRFQLFKIMRCSFYEVGLLWIVSVWIAKKDENLSALH